MDPIKPNLVGLRTSAHVATQTGAAHIPDSPAFVSARDSFSAQASPARRSGRWGFTLPTAMQGLFKPGSARGVSHSNQAPSVKTQRSNRAQQVAFEPSA
ncbi:MAG: hypothetical protein EOO40_10690, partial [Deltaproteobacteria bacterium]